MTGRGMNGGESNGECPHGQQTSGEKVWVAMVYSMHLPRYPDFDSRRRLAEGVSMSRKSNISYD
jgi:hypothetical protein